MGMFGMLIMAVLISISDIISPTKGVAEVEAIEGKKIPIFIAVLASLVIPTIFAIGTLLIKYVD